MGILLPIAAAGLLWTVMATRRRSWREAALDAAALWCALLVAITEGLSLFHALRPGAVAAAWAGAVIILGILAVFACRGRLPQTANTNGWRRLLRRGRNRLGRLAHLPWSDRLILAGLTLIVLVIAGIALVAPPNTWDGLTYHLPRVMHWMQNRSVEHYPTHIQRQLWMNPLPEFIILHGALLWGSDRLANLGQCLAMLGCLLGVSQAARLLGLGVRGQILAAVLAGTLPIGVLQASGVQTDWFAALWLVSLLVLCLRLAGRATPPGASEGAQVGLLLGLASLTKGTTYLFAWPALLLLAPALPRWGGRSAGAALATAAVVAASLNLGYLGRNLAVYGQPFGPGAAEQRNAHLGVGVTFSNLVRNAAMHLVAPSQGWTLKVGHSVVALHRAAGLDVHDPGTSYEGQPFRIPVLMMNEDVAGNPWHFLLALAAFVAILGVPRLRRDRRLLLLAAGFALAVLLFCALVRWQHSASRLHLPLFVLAAAPMAAAACRLLPGWTLGCLAALLLAAATPALVLGHQRPLWRPDTPSILTAPRLEQYVRALPPRARNLPAIALEIRRHGMGKVGLVCPEEEFEYLLWVHLHTDSAPAEIRHVRVGNPSARTADAAHRDFVPQVVVVREGETTQLIRVAPPSP